MAPASKRPVGDVLRQRFRTWHRDATYVSDDGRVLVYESGVGRCREVDNPEEELQFLPAGLFTAVMRVLGEPSPIIDL